MPTKAQDGDRRGPLAALLILLSLFLGSATAAAGADLRGPATRLGAGRHNIAAALPPATRGSLDDETSSAGGDPSVLPSRPGIVTERLWAIPRAATPSRPRVEVPQRGSASYRARAPPAS